MKFIGISLILLACVILVVSLVYIISISRTKERLAMIEKNMDLSQYGTGPLYFNSLKMAFLFIGGGLGFILALLIDEYILISIDNPAIYAGSVLLFAGIGLLVYHKFFKAIKG